jgi:hypothetical protein
MDSSPSPLNTGRPLGGGLDSPLSPITSPIYGSRSVSNPLLSKVTAALSTSYTDSEFRQTLTTLDGRRVSYDAETRRQLRLHLQKEVIQYNGDIIGDFGIVADQLRRIGRTLDKLNRGLLDMKAYISPARGEAPCLHDSGLLMSQKADIDMMQHFLSLFRERFMLSDGEIVALTLIDEPVDGDFFTALVKAKRIVKECEILLGLENQTLGLELTEQMSRHLSSAYQKLYKWIQREFKILNLDNPQMNASIRQALRVLAERPSLFRNCLSLFAEARERILSDLFCAALTGSSPNSTSDPTVKPIDMAAHDPLRYVGDMLAWIHSAAVSEREVLETLFISEGNEIARGLKTGKATELWHLAAEDGEGASDFDPLQTLNELVDKNVSGVSRLVRQRIDQVIQSNEDTITAYKLANLLEFYQSTFSKLLGTKSTLLDTLSGALAEALRQFRFLIRDRIMTLQGDIQQPPVDLRPPTFLIDSLRQLDCIMSIYETSIPATDDPEADFLPILAEAFEPFLSACENMAAALRRPQGSMFAINCYQAAIATLTHHEFSRHRANHLWELTLKEKSYLIEVQYLFFRHGSGLDVLFSATYKMNTKDLNEEVLNEMDAFRPDALSHASQSLDGFLPSALMDAIENLKPIQDPSLVRELTDEAVMRFCDDYARVEECLVRADSYSDGRHASHSKPLREFFPRTTGEVKVLLS